LGTFRTFEDIEAWPLVDDEHTNSATNLEPETNSIGHPSTNNIEH